VSREALDALAVGGAGGRRLVSIRSKLSNREVTSIFWDGEELLSIDVPIFNSNSANLSSSCSSDVGVLSAAASLIDFVG